MIGGLIVELKFLLPAATANFISLSMYATCCGRTDLLWAFKYMILIESILFSFKVIYLNAETCSIY